MNFLPTALKDAYLVEMTPFSDERGWFARTFCKTEFAGIGFQKEWVQINHSYSRHRGTIRGMHFQWPPHSEVKLVRCIAGQVYDVIVDLRRNSPTFLSWTSATLSAGNMRMLYIPEGFAHGFQTLSDHVELIYCHSAFYAPEAEGNLRFDDPTIGIEWPLTPTVISAKDRSRSLLTANFKGL